jgi:hypothetical protein
MLHEMAGRANTFIASQFDLIIGMSAAHARIRIGIGDQIIDLAA